MLRRIIVAGQKVCSSTECIKLEKVNADIRKITLQRWNECVGELFIDEREKTAIHRYMEVSKILKSECHKCWLR